MLCSRSTFVVKEKKANFQSFIIRAAVTCQTKAEYIRYVFLRCLQPRKKLITAIIHNFSTYTNFRKSSRIRILFRTKNKLGNSIHCFHRNIWLFAIFKSKNRKKGSVRALSIHLFLFFGCTLSPDGLTTKKVSILPYKNFWIIKSYKDVLSSQ